MMHGDQFRPVGESRLDLDVVQHLRHTVHDVLTGEYLAARGHQFGDAAPVTRPLEDVIGDDRHGFGMIQFQTPALPSPCLLYTSPSPRDS